MTWIRHDRVWQSTIVIVMRTACRATSLPNNIAKDVVIGRLIDQLHGLSKMYVSFL